MRATYRRAVPDNILLLLFAALFFFAAMQRHRAHLSSVFDSSDSKGYYVYLPAVFIYHNVHLPGDYDFGGRHLNDRGESYTKYTCGVAFCELPFFLAAHAYAHLTGAETNGFSAPYSIAIIVCAVLWGFLGLYVLKRILLQYFAPPVVWLSLICIMLGTGFYNYVSHEVGMSHVYSFALFALLLFVTDGYYKRPSTAKAIAAVLLFSWIVLIRPTNAVLLIFLVLYNVNTSALLHERVSFLRRHSKQLFLAIPFFFVLFVPQLLYWKEMTGQWVKYSYLYEHFDYLTRPKMLEVLIDPQNGLFAWAPVLLLFVWGVVMYRKDERANAWGVGIVFVVITYLFASWCAWWFGGAYGHRCYVEYYTVLIFPLAVTVDRLLTAKRYVVVALVALLILFFFYCNIRFTNLYMSPGHGVFDGPSWHWNWDSLIGLTRKIF